MVKGECSARSGRHGYNSMSILQGRRGVDVFHCIYGSSHLLLLQIFGICLIM